MSAAFPFQVDDVFGPSPWLLVDQAMITAFGQITHDPDPMHDDPAWATANSPFGGPIAYGFLTVSLLSRMLRSIPELHDQGQGGHFLNYGCDRLRLVAPAPAGCRVRGAFRVDAVRTEAAKTVVTFHTIVECEGEERPVLVADWLCAFVPAPSPVEAV